MTTFTDTWRGRERVWLEHPSGDPNLRVVTFLNGEDVQLRKFQAGTIEMISKGKSGQLIEGQWSMKIMCQDQGRAVVEADPGLGKSRMAIEAYKFICPQKPRVLVLCSKKALNTWRREFPKWHFGITDKHVQIVEGDPTDRRLKWEDQTKTVYVVTYQSGMNDDKLWQKLKFDFVICDECKLFINRNTKAYQYWSSWLKPNKMKYCILMDGTLVKRGPQDLWPSLHIIRPQMFTSYWKFVGAFCNTYDSPFGKQILGPKNTEGLANVLRPRFIRLKENNPEIKAQRPPLVRDLIEVEPSRQVMDLLRTLRKDLFAMTPSGNLMITPSHMGLVMKERQMMVCPAIFDPLLGIGTAFEDYLERLEEDPHAVLFTPFKTAIPHFIREIKNKGYPTPYLLVGGTDSNEVKRVEEEFNSPKGKDTSCIVTVKFAESFELYTARRGFFIGYEWSQLENYQAEKRLHRLITPHPVNIWYYSNKNTVDEYILEILNTKQSNVNITFQDYLRIQRELDEKERIAA